MGREQKIYNDYLMQRREEEKAQEKELNRLLEDIKAKKLAEKDRELALQRAARKQLMNEVMNTRKLQVQERCKEPGYIFLLFCFFFLKANCFVNIQFETTHFTVLF
jgi:hypothetical protein